jgi:hypothetical protein
MLLQLHVHFLSGLDVHNCKRGTPLTDSFENLSVAGIIRAVKFAFIHREAIRPEMESPLNALGALRHRTSGVFDHPARGIITTQGAGSTGEVRGSRLGLI